MEDKRKRGPRITMEQKNIMADFIEGHSQMIRGKFSSTFTADDSRKLWIRLAAILNSCNGPNKEWKEWRRVS